MDKNSKLEIRTCHTNVTTELNDIVSLKYEMVTKFLMHKTCNKNNLDTLAAKGLKHKMQSLNYVNF